MSTVEAEAAASLFGSDGDSGPDPFAVIGNEASTDTTPPHDEHQTHTSSHTSQMGQETSSFFAEQMYPDPQQEQHDPWSIPTAQDVPSNQLHRPSGLPSSYEPPQRYYPAATAYQPPSSHASTPASTTYQSAPASYEPYSPTPPTPYQPHSVIQQPAQQPYDPYKPTATVPTSNSYVPHQTARRLSGVPAQPQATQYDNRSPVPRSASSTYSSSFVVPSHPPPNGVPAQAPKPPSVASAAEFRPKVSNAYDPPLPPPKVHRTPPPSSLRFTSNPHVPVPHVPVPHVPVSHVPQPPPVNSYDHKPMPGPPRTMSPSSIRSASPASGSFPPPKSVSAHVSSQLRGRSSSNGSTMSSHSVPDPLQPRKEYGLGLGSHIVQPSLQSHHFAEQDVLHSARPPYAPSPSLLGSNDPLGRTSSRAPVISFGFGGKVLTCFNGFTDLNTGFDVALSSRHTTGVTIRVLHQLLPDYESETKSADYPGPLFSDPGSPVTSLVRTGISQAKTKKARVIKYLEERAEEILRGTMYISDHFERQRLEAKLVLVQLLKIMVENDGLLSGSPAIDNAVRAALLPRIVGSTNESGHDGPVGFVSPTFPMLNAYGSTSTLLSTKDSPISISTLLPSALDKIEEFLVRGERRQAYQFALDQRLWAHALVIASSVDKEAWKEAVNEFLKTELSVRETVQRGTPHVQSKATSSQQTNGREWLRVTYSVFSGQGPSAVQELVPMNVLSRTGAGLQVPPVMLPHATPMSPNFPSIAVPTQSIPVESLSKWPEIAASILCSPLSPDYSATLSTLGDHLISHHLVEGAHVCYLLSPQTSVMGGLGSPGTRLVLLGAQSPHINPVFFRDPDPIIFTEIAEFALSLKTAKGQDPFHGFPHLQAYKFIRAAYLADIGLVQSATRYCEAITTTMGRHSPHFTPTLAEGLKQLTDRLLGSPHIDRSSSWMGGKVNKPSLDSIGSWLEVRLTKFIAGEGNETSPSATEFSKAQFTGPFSSYSSITSATTSANPSPPPTIVNSYSAAQAPRRSGSAMALPSTTMHVPVDRASSAMEYYRPPRHSSPAPPNTAPIRSTGYPYSSYMTQPSGPSMVNGYAAAYDSEPSSRKTSLEITAEEGSEAQYPLADERQREEEPQQPKSGDSNQETRDSGGWWNSLGSADTASTTPTAATFHPIESIREVGEGFISLMDDPALSMTPNMTASPRRTADNMFDDEADDLGLGNSAPRRKRDEPTKMAEDKSPAASVQDTTKGDEKRDTQSAAAASTGSWLSRLWKRPEAAPGPVRANLGEETSFYYDKEQKRWVNKKAGTEVAKPSAAPPPPLRAQTASPGASNSRYNGTPNGTVFHHPPPPRTASTIDLNAPATFKVPMRARPNLALSEIASMPNTPAPSGMPSAPPMGRSRSQAAKKNVRNRYVDVFQQGGSPGV